MFKKLLLVSFLIVGAATVHAQTLKITDVDYDDKRMNNADVNGLLGKSITLTFFDRKVRVVMAGDKPVVLSKDSGKSYSVSGDYGKGSTMSWYLQTETTLSVVTSIIYKVTISEKVSPFRSSTLTVTGKRF
jgi:hypothetical protein